MLVEIIHLGPECVVSPRQVLLANGNLIVGRSSQCQLAIGDQTVSRQHAQIAVKKDRVTVRDLDSTNGTFVNSERFSARQLQHGMRLRFGRVEFLLTIAEHHPGNLDSDADTVEWKARALSHERLRDVLQSVQVQLSDSEFRVLGHLAHGWSDKEIAERIRVSLHTVQTHNKAIFKKMGVHARTQLVCRLNEIMPKEQLTDESFAG